MNGPNGEDLLLEYLRGSTPPERMEELQRALEKLGYSPAELEELRRLYCGIGSVVNPTPSAAMTTNFYAMLAAEKQRASTRRGFRHALGEWLRTAAGARLMPQLATAAALLVIGWAAGIWIEPDRRADRRVDYLTAEMAQMKKLVMFSMLNRDSATERLQAIEYLSDIAAQDDQALGALVATLDRDANVNVRLAALDALSELAVEPRVRDRLLASIEQQQAPLVLLQLVDIMGSLDEKRAIGPLKHLLERPDLDVTVRDRVVEELRYLM